MYRFSNEVLSINILVRKGKMGGRRKGKDPNHGNSTMVKMRRFMVQVILEHLYLPCHQERSPIEINLN